jgi:hypothetical protein
MDTIEDPRVKKTAAPAVLTQERPAPALAAVRPGAEGGAGFI